MRLFTLITLLLLLFSTAAAAERLAMVGGTLIDGNGGPPLTNSVILIENERISAVGQVGQLDGARWLPRSSPPRA
jgi:hypothetical protein